MTDKELVQKVHNGNQEALGDIIERYYEDIFRFCLYMVREEEEAYDITQETFLKFIKYGSSYRRNNLKGYLLTIARNLCFSFFRKQKESNQSCKCEWIEKIPEQKDKIPVSYTHLCAKKATNSSTSENWRKLLGYQLVHFIIFMIQKRL